MKRIEPIIMTPAFERIAIIDDYISLIWTSRYFTSGDFELVLPVKYFTLVNHGDYILRTDDEYTGVIEYKEIEYNEDGVERVIIKGRFLTGLLARRIIPFASFENTPPEDVMIQVVVDNTINTTPERIMPGFQTQQDNIRSDGIDTQYDGENLLETLSALGETYSIGFKVVFDSDYKFNFKVYHGTDRSYNQTVNPHIVFSDENENLNSSNLIQDYQERITDVYVRGEDDGFGNRVYVWSDTKETGLNRFESYIDATSTSAELVEYAVYLKQLKAEGAVAVTQYSNHFSGDVNFNSYEWNKDVFLGDIVEIENAKWGVSIPARIIEVIESIDEAGLYTIIPTFAV